MVSFCACLLNFYFLVGKRRNGATRHVVWILFYFFFQTDKNNQTLCSSVRSHNKLLLIILLFYPRFSVSRVNLIIIQVKRGVLHCCLAAFTTHQYKQLCVSPYVLSGFQKRCRPCHGASLLRSKVEKLDRS